MVTQKELDALPLDVQKIIFDYKFEFLEFQNKNIIEYIFDAIIILCVSSESLDTHLIEYVKLTHERATRHKAKHDEFMQELGF